MSSNVGLSTPRGSGTSGYVQRNMSLLKPRRQEAPLNADETKKLPEEEIETRVQALREKLLAEVDGSSKIDARGLKPHQVHELAAAKMVESERLRNALGISKDYEEGSHWRRQEEEKIRRMEQREQGNSGSTSARRRSVSPRRRNMSPPPRRRNRDDSPPRWRDRDSRDYRRRARDDSPPPRRRD